MFCHFFCTCAQVLETIFEILQLECIIREYILTANLFLIVSSTCVPVHESQTQQYQTDLDLYKARSTEEVSKMI